MTDYKRLTYAFSFMLLVLVLVIPASASDEPPSINTMAMEGSLTIDSELAATGTVITAMSGDEVVGTVTVETGGIFGDEAWNKLYVKEPSGIGKITLYAELSSGSVVVAEGIDWSNADVQIDINAVTDSTNDGDESSSGSSSSSSSSSGSSSSGSSSSGSSSSGSSSSGSSYTIITLSDDADEAVAGSEGVKSDTPISAHTVPPTAESTSTTGEAGSSSNTFLIVGIIIIVAIVAFVIYQKSKY